MIISYSQETQQLVVLAKAGDAAALDRLCRIYGERVRRIVRLRMSRNLRIKLDSMDIVQEALLDALRGLGDFTYKNEGDFLRWLSRIAQNALGHHLEKLHANKRDIRREVRLDNYGPTTGGGLAGTPGLIEVTTPSVIMSRKEELDKLEKAIDELKPEHKEVIVLTKIEGLSYKEIGDRLGKSADAVGMLLSRAMVALTITYEKV
ncbi:MAG: sigma-70 family RNA polymerase sigma factor [Planctomycetes bacterium]|nr:sigma-70 family RNA polymerase sigma factor [Planctomycetota bacterium]